MKFLTKWISPWSRLLRRDFFFAERLQEIKGATIVSKPCEGAAVATAAKAVLS